jgi:hypothetical protein
MAYSGMKRPDKADALRAVLKRGRTRRKRAKSGRCLRPCGEGGGDMRGRRWVDSPPDGWRATGASCLPWRSCLPATPACTARAVTMLRHRHRFDASTRLQSA